MVKMIAKKSSRKFKSKTVKIKGYYLIFIFLIFILLDRVTKIWASNVKISKDYGIFAFTYLTNTGSGFSLLQNVNLILIIISIIALILLICFHKFIPKLSFITIISGIVGNLIDRITYGSVIDFINFKIWPVFNVADTLICIGVVYWIILIIRDERKSTVKK